jgi:hypothetical protein
MIASYLCVLGAAQSGDGRLTSLPPARSAAVADDLAVEIKNLDPRLEGWETEAFNSAAGARISALGKALHDPSHLDASLLAELVGAGFTCADLRPDELHLVSTNGPLSVRRGAPGAAQERGADGFARALRDLCAAYAAGAEVHLKNKIVGIDDAGGGKYASNHLIILFGSNGPGTTQQTCDWRVEWEWSDKSSDPRMLAVRCTRYEEVVASGPILSDCTEAVLGANAAWKELLLRGTDDWCRRIDLAAGMNQYAHNGLAVGDVDGDGLEDLYLCQGGGLPNKLFLHLPDGRARDVSAEWGVDWLDESRAALILDLDNDAAPELVISTENSVLVMRRVRGRPGFELAREIAFPGGYSIAAADVDGDKLLDLYVCRYATANQPNGLPAPYHDAENGPTNALWRNLGGLAFEDATAKFGLDHNNTRFSFAAEWADYDEDDDLDLYVANDFGRNNLYRNEGGRFRDVAGSAGVEDISAGMGVSFGDFDGDARLDIYISNMFSSAGQRIAYQRAFLPELGADVRGQFQRHARGNSLFKSRGDGTFDDVTMRAGVSLGRWAWGAQFVEIDGDGRPDLFVPNGFITNEDTEDL